MPGWSEDISGCKTFENLPINAQNYVLKVESLLHVPIRWIGVGEDRNHLIERH
jgi:adenylosuccinate synthase